MNERYNDFFNRPSKVYWLSGILKCPFCGGYYTLANSGNHSYYVCSNRLKRSRKGDKCSNNKYVNAEQIESSVEEYLLKFNNKATFENVYAATNIKNEDNNKINELRKLIDKNAKIINSLVDKLPLFSNDAAANIVTKIESLTAENKSLNAELENEKLNLLEAKTSIFNENYIFQNINLFHNAKTPQEKRSFMKNIFESLVYNPEDKSLRAKFL